MTVGERQRESERVRVKQLATSKGAGEEERREGSRRVSRQGGGRGSRRRRQMK